MKAGQQHTTLCVQVCRNRLNAQPFCHLELPTQLIRKISIEGTVTFQPWWGSDPTDCISLCTWPRQFNIGILQTYVQVLPNVSGTGTRQFMPHNQVAISWTINWDSPPILPFGMVVRGCLRKPLGNLHGHSFERGESAGIAKWIRSPGEDEQREVFQD